MTARGTRHLVPRCPAHSMSAALRIRTDPSGSRTEGSSPRSTSAATQGTVRPSQRAASGRVSVACPSIPATGPTVPAAGREVQGRANRCHMPCLSGSGTLVQLVSSASSSSGTRGSKQRGVPRKGRPRKGSPHRACHGHRGPVYLPHPIRARGPAADARRGGATVRGATLERQ